MNRLLSSAVMLLAVMLGLAASPKLETFEAGMPLILYDEALTINGLEQLVKLHAKRYILLYQNN